MPTQDRNPFQMLQETRRCFSSDTSSLILLQRTGLLETAAAAYRLLVTKRIWDELRRGCAEAEGLIFSRATTCLSLSTAPQEICCLSPTDAEVIALYHAAGTDAVLSDDGRLLRYCRRFALTHYCSLSLLSLLVHDGKLRPTEAEFAFSRLLHVGRYSRAITSHAHDMLQRAAGRFSSTRAE